MKEKKKLNNKGFSLVELIVVVLIMAIIAVALAPQVMKWVNNSRIAVDRQTVDAAVSIARLALTDEKANNAVVGTGGSEYTITINNSGCTIKRGTEDPGAGDAFVKAFCNNIGVTTANSITGIVMKSTNAEVKITIDTTGLVSSNAESVLISTDLDS